MPVTHVSKVFAVKDCRVSKLTADVAGSAPTYGASVDVPGIKTVGIEGDMVTAELRGDNSRLDYSSAIGGVSASIEHAKLSLDVLNVLLGSAITDAGTTPNQTATLGIGSLDAPNYFRLQAVAVGADPIGGDVMFTLYKCVLDSFPELGLEEEDYRTSSFDVQCLPLLGTPANRLMDVSIRETTAALT